MSRSQAQTTKIKLHPLLFLQEKQHQRRGEIVSVIMVSSDIAGSGDVLLLEEFCISEPAPRWAEAPVGTWSGSRGFNCWVQEMSLRREVVGFAARISPCVTWRVPPYLTWNTCQAGVLHGQQTEMSCYFGQE